MQDPNFKENPFDDGDGKKVPLDGGIIPLEGGIFPIENTLSIDRQTDFETSNAKTKIGQAIEDGDKKVKEASEAADRKLRESIDAAATEISSIESEVDTLSSQIEDGFRSFEQQLSFQSGDPNSEFTAPVIKKELNEYKKAMEHAINVLQDQESHTPEQIIRAQFFVRNYGDVKSIIGFIKFKLDGGYNSIKDNLSTKDSEEYEAHVEKLKADLVSIYKDRDFFTLHITNMQADLAQFLKENKPNGPDDTYVGELGDAYDKFVNSITETQKSLVEAINKASDLEGKIIRITDEDKAFPDSVKDRYTDIDGLVQYINDNRTRNFEEFQNDLDVNRLGDTLAGTEYNQHRAMFQKVAKKHAQIIGDLEKKAEEGELTPEEQLELDASKLFRTRYSLVANVVSVITYTSDIDAKRWFDFSTQAASEYVEFITMLITDLLVNQNDKEEAQNTLVNLPGEEDEDYVAGEGEGSTNFIKNGLEESIAKYTESIDSIEEELGKYAIFSDTELTWGFYYPGYVRYNADNEEDEFREFEDNLRNNVIGDLNAGGYYRRRVEAFKLALEEYGMEAKKVKAAEEALLPGEELSPNMAILKAKTEFFANEFGTTLNHIGVDSFSEHAEDWKHADFSYEGAYGPYVEHVDSLKRELESVIADKETTQSDIDNLPGEEDEDYVAGEGEGSTNFIKSGLEEMIAKYTIVIETIEEQLSEITCDEDRLDGRQFELCASGAIVYALNVENRSDNDYRENLEKNIIGNEESSHGDYWRQLTDQYNAALSRAKNDRSSIKKAEESLKPGEVLSDKQLMMKARSEYFFRMFGDVANVINVNTYNESVQSFFDSDMEDEAYSRYREDVETIKTELETNILDREATQNDIDQLPAEGDPGYVKDGEENSTSSVKAGLEEAIANYDQVIESIKHTLSRYTCDDPNSDEFDYILCHDGALLHALDLHDSASDEAKAAHDEEYATYKASNTEVIGINPATEVVDLAAYKVEFQTEMEEAINIVDNPSSAPNLEVYLAASEFINRFGRSVNATSYSEWRLWNLEKDTSNAVGEIHNFIDCAIENVGEAIESSVELTQTINAPFMPSPNGIATKFYFLPLIKGDKKVTSVTLNGLVVGRSNYSYSSFDSTIEFTFTPQLRDNIVVTMECSANVEVSIDLSECSINLADSLTQGDAACLSTTRSIKSVERLIEVLESKNIRLKAEESSLKTFIANIQTLIAEYNVRKEKAETAKAQLQKLNDMDRAERDQALKSISEYQLQIDRISGVINKFEANLEKVSSQLSEEEDSIARSEDLLAVEMSRANRDEGAIASLESKIAELNKIVKTRQDEIDVLKAEISKLESAKQTLMEDLSQTEEDLNLIMVKIEKFEAALFDLLETIFALTNNLRDMENHLIEIIGGLKPLMARIAENVEAIDIAKTNKTTLEEFFAEKCKGDETFTEISTLRSRTAVIANSNQASSRSRAQSSRESESTQPNKYKFVKEPVGPVKGEKPFLPDFTNSTVPTLDNPFTFMGEEVLEVIERVPGGEGEGPEPSAIQVANYCGLMTQSANEATACVAGMCSGGWPNPPGNWPYDDGMVDLSGCPTG